jgi:hypothetical protein
MPVDVRADTARSQTEELDAFFDRCAQAGPRCAFSASDPHRKFADMIARLKHSGGSRLAAVLGTVSHRLQSSTRWTSMATSLQGVYDSLRPDRRRAIPADGSGRATASGRHANCPPGDRGNAPADRHPPHPHRGRPPMGRPSPTMGSRTYRRNSAAAYPFPTHQALITVWPAARQAVLLNAALSVALPRLDKEARNAGTNEPLP